MYGSRNKTTGFEQRTQVIWALQFRCHKSTWYSADLNPGIWKARNKISRMAKFSHNCNETMGVAEAEVVEIVGVTAAAMSVVIVEAREKTVIVIQMTGRSAARRIGLLGSEITAKTTGVEVEMEETEAVVDVGRIADHATTIEIASVRTRTSKSAFIP